MMFNACVAGEFLIVELDWRLLSHPSYCKHIDWYHLNGSDNKT